MFFFLTGEPNLQSLWRPEYAAYMIEGILSTHTNFYYWTSARAVTISAIFMAIKILYVSNLDD